jgi:hypothetical protein
MLRVSYKEQKTNDQVLCEAKALRKLINKTKQGRAGRVMCAEGIENPVTSGNIQGKGDRDRQR